MQVGGSLHVHRSGPVGESLDEHLRPFVERLRRLEKNLDTPHVEHFDLVLAQNCQSLLATSNSVSVDETEQFRFFHFGGGGYNQRGE